MSDHPEIALFDYALSVADELSAAAQELYGAHSAALEALRAGDISAARRHAADICAAIRDQVYCANALTGALNHWAPRAEPVDEDEAA